MLCLKYTLADVINAIARNNALNTLEVMILHSKLQPKLQRATEHVSVA
jgi:hypothetical protein